LTHAFRSEEALANRELVKVTILNGSSGAMANQLKDEGELLIWVYGTYSCVG